MHGKIWNGALAVTLATLILAGASIWPPIGSHSAAQEAGHEAAGDGEAAEDNPADSAFQSPLTPTSPELYVLLSQPGPLWLVDKDLSGQNLYGANLWRANLRGANLQGAILTKAILMGAELTLADLTAAVVDQADMQVADLSQATLRNTSLRGANLVNARLEGAILEGADLSGANLTGAMLEGAAMRGIRYDELTTWPEGFDPETIAEMPAEEAHNEASAALESAAVPPQISRPAIIGMIAIGITLGIGLVLAVVAWLWFLTWASKRWDAVDIPSDRPS